MGLVVAPSTDLEEQYEDLMDEIRDTHPQALDIWEMYEQLVPVLRMHDETAGLREPPPAVRYSDGTG